MNQRDSNHHWWGDFDVPVRKWARWQVGPFTLWARRTADEWRLGWRSESDPVISDITIEIPSQTEPVLDDFEVARFTLKNAGAGLSLKPCLADLSVVVRPETPVWIPPGQTAVLYLGTIVSVVIKPAGADQPHFIELPIFRMSDTWFGSNTRYGEFCYASKSRARTGVKLLGYVPHRAITPVEISNRGADTLDIEQLRIPVTALNLYETSSGKLWTDGVRFTREGGRMNAEFDIIQDSTYLPEDRVRIAEPRRPVQRKTVMQAFSSIFR